MLAVYGVLLLASAALVFVWAYGQFRRAVPKKWTTRESASNAIVLTMISLLSFGVGLEVKAVIAFANDPITLVEAALIVAVIAVAFVLGRALRRSAARHMAPAVALQPGTTSVVAAGAAAANDSGPGNGPRPAHGAGRRVA